MIDKNKKTEILDKLIEIRKLIVIEDDAFLIDVDKYDSPFQTYGNIVISGLQNIVKFHRIIDYIWFSDKLINENYPREKIIKEVLHLISLNANLTLLDINDWLTSLEKQEQKDYWIYKGIKGAELSKNESVKLGPFVIVNKNYHKDLIINQSDFLGLRWNDIWQNCPDDLLIGIKLSVRDVARGYQLAEKQFSLFENIIKFLIPDYDKYTELSIVDIRESRIDKSFALNIESYNKSSTYLGRKMALVDLNNPKLCDLELGTKYLFDIVEKQNPNDIEKRLLKAIDWVGKGLKETDNSKGFIQLMFAIEALLNYRKGEIIEPSILSKVSEFIAFTLGEDYLTRIELEKEFKNLYGIRSAIAHGDTKNISHGDFILLVSMTNRLIWSFIRNKDLKDCIKMDDYIEWIKKKKYN